MATPDATLEFDPDSACLGSTQQGAVVALARRVLSERVEGIGISGPFADGSSLRGRRIGLERARAVASALRQSLQRMSPGSERQMDIALTSHAVGGSEGEGTEAFVATVRFQQAPPVVARVFGVTAESIAAPREEAVPESGLFPITLPETDARRLVSRAELRALHRGTRLLSLSVGRVVSACSPDLPFSSTRVDGSRLRFRWDMQRSLPADSAWHRVEGLVDSSSGTPLITLLTVEGSPVASHRAWVDGNLRHDIGPRGTYLEPWAASRSRAISA